MQTVWVAYIIAAATASALFMIAGWRSRQAAPLSASRTAPVPEIPRLPIRMSHATTQALGDAAEAIHIALKRLAPLIDRRFMRVEVAARPGLLIRIAAPVLVELVEEMLATAIHAAPASTLLLVASPRGEHIDISVTDDMPVADPAQRQSQVRRLQEQAVMRGGSLDIRIQPEDGTTLTLRLAAAFDTPAELEEAEPAKVRQLL